MPWAEVSRLLEILALGIDAIEHVVELEWAAVESVAHRLEGSRAIVAVRVPRGVERGEAELALRSLGAVQVGLVQYGTSTAWAEVAWQERAVKAPLLSALKRHLQAPDHPFARLGIAKLPIDELAKLTPEPVELLRMVEDAIAHRVRHARYGLEPDDWLRSVRRAAADRLATRLLAGAAGDRERDAAWWPSLEVESLVEVIDLLLTAPREPFPQLEGGTASVALAEWGLAWIDGGDVLLSPLAAMFGRADTLGRMAERLPERAWSERGRAALKSALSGGFPAPPAALVVPEPPYARWPVLELEDPFVRVREAIHVEIERETMRIQLGSILDWIVGRSERDVVVDAVAPQGERERGWLALLDAGIGALRDFANDRIRAIDVERGRSYRFDAVDAASGVSSAGAEVAAIIRWLAVARNLEYVEQDAELEMLIDVVEQGARLASGVAELSVALRCLAGDLWAMRRRYAAALDEWAAVESWRLDEHSEYRVRARRVLALLRCERVDDAVALLSPQMGDPAIPVRLNEADSLALAMIAGLCRHMAPSAYGALNDLAGKVSWITELAVDVDLGDWPRIATSISQLIDMEHEDAVRARFVRAWIAATFGDIDASAASFDELLEHAKARGDVLSWALAERGRALVATQLGNHAAARAALERVVELEEELGLPDAKRVAASLAAHAST